MLAVAFGSISFMTYAISFWAPPYAIRTFYGAARRAGPDHRRPHGRGRGRDDPRLGRRHRRGDRASSSGGIISDLWRRRDPRGRIFVNMLAVVLPAPACLVMFTTDSLATFYLASPVAQLFGSAWVGAAVASLQDVVLPRMRATAGATYVLGTTMVGLALGPYFAGKMADVTAQPQRRHLLALRRAALHPARLVARLAPHRRPRSHQGRARPRRRRADLARRRQHAAGDPGAAIAAGIGAVIVGIGVDHHAPRRRRRAAPGAARSAAPAMVNSSRPAPLASTSRLARSPR